MCSIFSISTHPEFVAYRSSRILSIQLLPGLFKIWNRNCTSSTVKVSWCELIISRKFSTARRSSKSRRHAQNARRETPHRPSRPGCPALSIWRGVARCPLKKHFCQAHVILGAAHRCRFVQRPLCLSRAVTVHPMLPRTVSAHRQVTTCLASVEGAYSRTPPMQGALTSSPRYASTHRPRKARERVSDH